MTQRAIVIFPAFIDEAQATEIERLRQAWRDPLAGMIAAHLTLVFPFESDLEADVLEAHIRTAAAGIGRFPLALREVPGQEDEYLFLNVEPGKEEVILLHDRLYTGPLEEHLSRSHPFMPHVTIGRLTKETLLEMVKRTRLSGAPYVAEARALTLYHIEESVRAVERVVALG